jgi:hypothetical protein
MAQHPQSARLALVDKSDGWRGRVLGFVGTASEHVRRSVAAAGGRAAPGIAPARSASLAGRSLASSGLAECACPDDCPRDHPNE